MNTRYGVGLRSNHYPDWLEGNHSVGVVEAITENFAGRGGRPLAVLEKVRKDADLSLHGVSLGLGNIDPVRDDALRKLAALAQQLEVTSVSDHLCFTGHGGFTGHDLWPLPFTEEAADHVAARIRRVQDVLQRRIAVENIAAYVTYQHSEMTEPEFLCEIAERADCSLLLDINNIYVNSINNGYQAKQFIEQISSSRIQQFHLAGHSDFGSFLFDDHRGPVSPAVWDLFSHAVALHGERTTIIEWDEDIPSLSRVVQEARHAQETAGRAGSQPP